MRLFYTFIFSLLIPLMVFRLLWRSLKQPAYRQRLAERFAFFSAPKFEKSIWVHAVSLGESIAVTPLIQKLQADFPGYPIVITTTTPTGSARIRANFKDSVFHVYAPYDLPIIVRRFLRKVKPQVAIFVETELWPNTLTICQQQQIKTVLFNGRLSDRSAKRYGKVNAIAKQMLQAFTHIIAQTDIDANNFKQLGAKPESISVTGSVKFDVSVAQNVIDKGNALRAALGANRPVWIAASTHDGEEGKILEAHQQVQQQFPDALLMMVPRHPDRFQQVAGLIEQAGCRYAKRSEALQPPADIDVYLGDTMGEMMIFYGACDVAFVGGSFIELGGHNMLEPAVLHKPVLSGPCVINFLLISQMLCSAGGMKLVNNATQLATELQTLFANPEQAKAMGQKAYAVIEKNRGAFAKQAAIVEELL